jgi:hypothetical protein
MYLVPFQGQVGLEWTEESDTKLVSRFKDFLPATNKKEKSPHFSLQFFFFSLYMHFPFSPFPSAFAIKSVERSLLAPPCLPVCLNANGSSFLEQPSLEGSAGFTQLPVLWI